MEFPVLEISGLSSDPPGREATDVDAAQTVRFARGDAIIWTAKISERFHKLAPQIRVRWRSPSGEVVLEATLRRDRKRTVSSTFDSTDAELGRWTLEVDVGDSEEDRLFFDLVASQTPGQDA